MQRRSAVFLATFLTTLTTLTALAEPADSLDSLETLERPVSLHCSARPPGVIAWWPLDEMSGQTAFDLIDGNAGSLQGAPMPTAGVVEGGLLFDGLGDHVQIPQDSMLNLGDRDFSIELWLAAPAATGVQPILDKRNNLPTGYHLFLYNGLPGIQLARGGSFRNYVAVSPVGDGLPHHLAFTVDRDDPQGLKIYVDGILRLTEDPTPYAGSLDNLAPLTLGIRSSLGGTSFNGLLDEATLYSRALAPFEVLTIALQGKEGKCKCFMPGCFPVAWWPFDIGLWPSGRDVAGHVSGPHDVTLTGRSVLGKVGGGWLLDGADDVGSVANQSAINLDLEKPGAYSLALWISTTKAGQVILSNGFIGGFYEIPIGYSLSLGSDGRPAFGIVAETEFLPPFGFPTLSFASLDCPACPDIADGVWHHVGVAVRHGAAGASTSLEIYVDGKLRSISAPTDLEGRADGSDLRFGDYPTMLGPLRYEGSLDEVMIFDHSLVEADFASLFGAGPEGVCRPQVEEPCGSRGLPAGCPAGKFCDYFPNSFCGGIDAGGVCRVPPQICTFEVAPVCGCDGQTYSNACAAAQASMSIDHNGPC